MTKKFKCFNCKSEVSRSEIAKSGYRNGGHWYVCRECHASWVAERKLDKQAYQASEGMVSGEELGWNGVPSQRALRRRG